MTIHAIYASTSGNVEAVVEKTADVLRSKGLVVELHRAEQTSIDVLKNNDTFLLASSTWEHGVLNPFFQKLHAEMQSMEASGKKAALIGLGDTRYEPVLFCEGIEQIKRTWLDRGGQQLGQTLKINGEPYHVLDTVVQSWAEQVATELLGHSAP